MTSKLHHMIWLEHSWLRSIEPTTSWCHEKNNGWDLTHIFFIGVRVRTTHVRANADLVKHLFNARLFLHKAPTGTFNPMHRRLGNKQAAYNPTRITSIELNSCQIHFTEHDLWCNEWALVAGSVNLRLWNFWMACWWMEITVRDYWYFFDHISHQIISKDFYLI